MGRLLTITRSDTAILGVRKRTVSPQIRIGNVSLGFILLILVCVLGLFYLTQSNQIATKGYKIRDLEEKKESLLKEKERMQFEANRLQSIKEIQSGAETLNMVPADKINYINTGGNGLAQK